MEIHTELKDPYIYLLSSEHEYNNALLKGLFVRESIETEGFIHASPKNQLTRVANKYYKDTVKPLILVVETKKINVEVKWETAAGSLYPHIYGALNTDAIIRFEEISLNENGEFNI